MTNQTSAATAKDHGTHQPTLRFANLLTSLVFVFLMAGLSQATTIEKLDLDGLVKKADKIVVGKVRGSRTYWSANGKLILTNYTIDVEETMKGEVAPTVELTTIGGKIGDITLYVSGMPTFAQDESTVLFVENSGPFSTVAGLGQGKFTIANGQVSNNIAGLEFANGGVSKTMKMSLREFRRQIKLLLDR
jgi:hypothetical protein